MDSIKATEKQIKMICWKMKENDMPCDIPLDFLDELSLGDASIIIKSLLGDHPETGYQQLKHLFTNR